MPSRRPVIIVVSSIVSGVVSWALRIRDKFQGNPDYDIQLLCVGSTRQERPEFDLHVPDKTHVELILRKHSPAIVIPNYRWWVFDIAANLISKGFDLKCIGYCRADSEDEYYQRLSHYEPLISWFVSVSPRCSEALSLRLPHRISEMNVLPTGVIVPTNLRREYQTRPIRIIYAGRVIQHQKRVLDLVAIAALLRQAAVDFSLTILGEGSELNVLRDAFSADIYRGVVHFRNPASPEEMTNQWLRHDVMVQFSSFEGTSNSMLEAMAVGTVPCVTRTKSGVEGIIEHGSNGCLVEIGDMGSMADAIRRLALNHNMLSKSGKAAHTTAQEFCITKHARSFQAILDSARSATPRIHQAREFVKARATRRQKTGQTVKRAVSGFLDLSPRMVYDRLRECAPRIR